MAKYFLTCDDKPGQIIRVSVDNGSPQDVQVVELTQNPGNTVGSVPDLTALSGVVTGYGAIVLVNGVPWVSVPRADIDPDGSTQIAGVYTPIAIGWLKLAPSDLAALETQIVFSAATSSNSFWLHPDNGISAAAGAVTGWLDYLSTVISGHVAHHGTDPTLPANRFVLSSLANGCPALANNAGATSHLLQGGAGSASGSHTFCSVIDLQFPTVNNFGYVVEPASGVGLETVLSGTKYGYILAGVSHNPIVDSINCAGLQTACWVFDASLGRCSFFLNGKRIGVAPYSASVFNPLSIGSSTISLTGKLASIFYVNKADYSVIDTFTKWANIRCATPKWKPIVLYDDLENDSSISARAAFSQQSIVTTATKSVIEWTCPTPLFGGPESEIALFRNGTPAILDAINSGANATYSVLAGGAQTLTIRDGTSAYSQHIRADKIYLNDPNATIISSSPPNKRIVIFGDSIAVGYRTTNPTIDAWTMLVRAVYAGRLTNYGWGGAQLVEFAATPTLRTATANTLISMLDGLQLNQLWIALGYNDAAAGVPAATFQSCYKALIQEILSKNANVYITAQGPIAATIESLPTPLPAIRDATRNACLGTTARYVDGITDLAVPIGPDGVHPDNATSIIYKNNALPFIY